MIAKKIFIDTLALFIVIAFFGITFKNFFGIANPYLQTTIVQETGIKITYYDYGAYIVQLNNSFNTFGQELQLEWPPRVWKSVAGLDWFDDLVNNLAFIFDWIYMPINVVLWPMRLSAWIVKQVFVILGFVAETQTINGTTYNPEWFMKTFTWMSEHLAIPYI